MRHERMFVTAAGGVVRVPVTVCIARLRVPRRGTNDYFLPLL
jgi:hypothetical protein